MEYLDETSDYSQHVKKKRYGKEYDPYRGVSYIAKEEQGAVYPGGYFYNKVREAGEGTPEKMSNWKRKAACYSVLQKHIKDKGTFRGYTAHKCVFSLSKKLERKAIKTGVSPDNILVQGMKDAMKKFQKKYHKGDQVGYFWGIHHDSDNTHIHVLMSNKTRDGVIVDMSRSLQHKRDYKRKEQRKEHIIDIQNNLDVFERRMGIKLDIILSRETVNAKIPNIKLKKTYSLNVPSEIIVIMIVSLRIYNNGRFFNN